MQQEREEVYAALLYAASFHCLAEEWKDCEELRPKPKEKWTFVDQKREKTMEHGSFYYCWWSRIGCASMLQLKIYREGRAC